MRISKMWLLIPAGVIALASGCASTSPTERPADVPAVDMSGAKKVESNGETAWQHAPTEADAAALLDKSEIKARWVTLYVNGLGCPQCASNIDLTLAKISGISWMYVDLGHGVVQMKLAEDAKRPSPLELKNKVTDAGFTLVKIRTQG
ncbi:MAG: heavy-metal-associated domain-containing protein [Tepidisphaera sp.]|jgi:copper chaperone CopZ